MNKTSKGKDGEGKKPRISEKRFQAVIDVCKDLNSYYLKKETKPSQQESCYRGHKTIEDAKDCDICLGYNYVQPPKSSECTCHTGFGVPSAVFRAIDCPVHKSPKLTKNNKLHKQGYDDAKKSILIDLKQIVKRNEWMGGYDYDGIAEGLLRYLKLIK